MWSEARGVGMISILWEIGIPTALKIGIFARLTELGITKFRPFVETRKSRTRKSVNSESRDTNVSGNYAVSRAHGVQYGAIKERVSCRTVPF